VSYVVDTNILVRLVLPHDPLLPIARAAVDELQRCGETLLVAAQNVMEFWAVATRPPTANGLGFTNERALEEVRRMEGLFRVIDQPAQTFRRWRQLIETHAVRGRQAFDAHLAALMMESGLERILTFNVDDFRRYPGITAVSPQSVATVPAPPP
jgi:predicted nucleic acid-binding protein